MVKFPCGTLREITFVLHLSAPILVNRELNLASIPYMGSPEGLRHCSSRVMVDASSHVPLYSVVESTQRVYGRRQIIVSERTSKNHNHHHLSV